MAAVAAAAAAAAAVAPPAGVVVGHTVVVAGVAGEIGIVARKGLADHSPQDSFLLHGTVFVSHRLDHRIHQPYDGVLLPWPRSLLLQLPDWTKFSLDVTAFAVTAAPRTRLERPPSLHVMGEAVHVETGIVQRDWVAAGVLGWKISLLQCFLAASSHSLSTSVWSPTLQGPSSVSGFLCPPGFGWQQPSTCRKSLAPDAGTERGR